MPSHSLLLAPTVADQLSRSVQAELDFLPVEITKSINLRYAANDFSTYTNYLDKHYRGRWQEPDILFKDKALRSTDASQNPRYLELLAVRHLDIADQFTKLKPFKINDERLVIASMEVGLSAAMFERYPVIWDFHVFVSEHVFRVLDSHLNRDYFCIHEIDLS
jgi:hypothetical protein